MSTTSSNFEGCSTKLYFWVVRSGEATGVESDHNNC